MHSLHMHDPAEWLQRYELASDGEAFAVPVGPLVAELAAGTRVADAHGHGPAVGSEHPSLDQHRLGMCMEHGLGRCSETTGDEYVPVTFRSECQFAHGLALGFFGCIPANTSSSRSQFLARA